MGWNDVELRHLHAFVAVYEARSFGKAAGLLGYTQGAVSQQIGALERAIGTPLFDRPGGPRPIEPTPAGDELLPHALAVFDRLEQARRGVDEVLGGTRGRLVIGSFESVSSTFLPDVVARLTRERPLLELELSEEIHDHRPLVDGVASGVLDVSFSPADVEHPGVRTIPILSDPYVAVIPREWAARLSDDGVLRPGSPRPTVPLDEVARSPLVGHVDADPNQSVVNLALHAIGATPRYVFRSADNGALQAMVRARLGIAVMPLLAVDTRDADVVVAHTDPAVPRRTITLVLRAGPIRSAALAGFVDLVEQTAVDYADRFADVDHMAAAPADGASTSG